MQSRDWLVSGALVGVGAVAGALGLLATAGAAFGQSQLGYYRQPAMHGDTIVFVAEGDLWKVPASGGTAMRLTSHPGDEANPRISPDGKSVAFIGTYEGPNDVYVMPLAGGQPKRLTFEGGSWRGTAVVGWRAAAGDQPARIIAATYRFSGLPDAQLTLIDPATGGREIVPLSQAADGVYDPSGRTLYFARLPFQGSQTKRYKGGTAQNLWKFTEGSEATPLTADFTGTSAQPMWWKDRLYFASDRDGTMEVWSMKPDGSDAKQQTNHAGESEKLLDVRGACMDASGNGRIVYQMGADLWLYDIASGADAKLAITLTSDFDQTREKWVKKPFDYLSASHISHTGDKVALTARGQVFVVPKEQGRLAEITRGANVRYRDARFMPDGKSLLAMSDESGEVEFWTAPVNGVGELSQLTADGGVLRWEGVPSPDGTKIAHHDKNQILWVFDIAAKTNVKIETNDWDNIGGVAWSPDSRYISFTAIANNFNKQVKIYDTQASVTHVATTDRFDSTGAAWSTDGKWLYVLSDRNIQSVVPSPWGPMQPEPFFDNRTKLYAIALKPGERFPFQANDELFEAAKAAKKDEPKDDKKPAEPATEAKKPDEAQPAEPKPESKKDEPAKDGAKKDEKPAVKVELVAEGLADRLYEVPLPPGNYGDLSVGEKRLFWLASESGRDGKTSLMAADIATKDVEAKTLVKDVNGYELSGDGKSLLIRKADSLAILGADAGPGADLSKAGVNLGGWSFSFRPQEEWRQMFVEAWRLERDYFYDRGMHGTDWPALLKRYLPLVDRVSTRAELSDLIAQMVGELSALHIFVYGGDLRRGDDQVNPGALGAVLTRDDAGGGWRVGKVYKSDPDYPARRAPLAQPGVDVVEGDIITKVNGEAALSATDPGELLRNTVGKQVLLHVKPAAGGEERAVIVKPISIGDEGDLRYHEWEYTRRLAVEKASNGEIGYVHLRAMGSENMSEFARGFYPVYTRKGLIIDVRHNRGGNIDSWIIARLLRKAWFYWQGRVGKPIWNMQYAFRGHIAVLCNEYTASDGEAFAEGIKRLKLGTVLGTRTWGGEIWLSSNNFLVDGGIATAAESGVYGPEGIWLIEGHGVDPDVVIDNPPHATFKGADAQLDAAIAHLKKRIIDEPVDVPPAPPHPDKSFPDNRPRP